LCGKEDALEVIETDDLCCGEACEVGEAEVGCCDGNEEAEDANESRRL